MSLLFNALKRAQGNSAKPVAETASPADEGAPAASPPKTNLLPYLIAGTVLLAGGLFWFVYQQNKYVEISTPRAAPAMASAPVAASAVAAVASSVAAADTLAALQPTASGGSAKKPWTHPRTAKKAYRRKLPRHAIAAEPDPLREGYLALSQGHLDLAEQKYRAALERHPHEKDALLGLAVIAQRKLQIDRATDLYRQVLREDMGNATAAAGLVSLSAQADPVAAESQLRELLDIKPAAPELHYALGNVLAHQLRWGEAQQSFYRAYSLEPDKALYAYSLAVSLDRLHQSSAALSYYKKALSKPGTLDQDAIARRIQELSTAEAH